jgi:RNA polymerase sigma-70 factor (ECF subfamily)
LYTSEIVTGADDEWVDARLAEAARAWPGVEVARERFLRALTAALDGRGMARDSIHTSDLYLALGCLAQDAEALTALERVVLVAVRPAIARACGREADVDDAVQATREKLLVGEHPKLAQYLGRGALVGWVRVVGVREALEAKRKTRREVADGDEALVDREGAGAQSLELRVLRDLHGPAFREAVQQALRTLDAEERTLLRMHVRDGLSIDRIAPMLGIHRATAARRLERARQRTLENVRAFLREKHGMSDSAAQSLCLALATEVDVSIGRALAPEGT